MPQGRGCDLADPSPVTGACELQRCPLNICWRLQVQKEKGFSSVWYTSANILSSSPSPSPPPLPLSLSLWGNFLFRVFPIRFFLPLSSQAPGTHPHPSRNTNILTALFNFLEFHCFGPKSLPLCSWIYTIKKKKNAFPSSYCWDSCGTCALLPMVSKFLLRCHQRQVCPAFVNGKCSFPKTSLHLLTWNLDMPLRVSVSALFLTNMIKKTVLKSETSVGIVQRTWLEQKEWGKADVKNIILENFWFWSNHKHPLMKVRVCF